MTTNPSPHRIDVHHHVWAPNYVRELPTPRAPFDWTPAKSIEDMDRAGVAVSVLSVTTPGVWWGDDAQGRRLARESNEYSARVVQDHAGRFGFFAALPLPDVEGSLRELEYALDVLHADGIGLMTSYASRWLGDPAFDAVFDEIDRRGAVVYTHPVAPDCCRNLLPDVNESVIEFATDTTRAIARMLFSGAAARYHNLRLIWSHGGGTVPFLLERLTRNGMNPNLKDRVGEGVLPELQRFYYDVAQAAHPLALASLTQLVPVSKILFGTDFPYRQSHEYVKMLADYAGFSDADRRAIDRDNALALLPGLAAK